MFLSNFKQKNFYGTPCRYLMFTDYLYESVLCLCDQSTWWLSVHMLDTWHVILSWPPASRTDHHLPVSQHAVLQLSTLLDNSELVWSWPATQLQLTTSNFMNWIGSMFLVLKMKLENFPWKYLSIESHLHLFYKCAF